MRIFRCPLTFIPRNDEINVGIRNAPNKWPDNTKKVQVESLDEPESYDQKGGTVEPRVNDQSYARVSSVLYGIWQHEDGR